MQPYYDLAIITKNRDLGAAEPYAEVQADVWTQAPNNISTYYASVLGKNKILSLIAAQKPDYIYINSMYSVYLSLIPIYYLLRQRQTQVKIVVAPRGMLQPHSLAVKPYKKKPFLFLMKLLGIHKKIVWQGTDEQEVGDIKKVLGSDIAAKVAPNLPKQQQPDFHPIPKEKGKASFVFLSRIHPIKNLHFFLSALPELMGEVVVDIYGSKEDETYWQTCQKLMAAFPAHIRAVYHKAVPPAEVAATLQQSHFFVLPTKGENFGHAIFDGLICGLPVVISNTTPWKNLAEKGIGWDLPLENKETWVKTLQVCVDMDNETYLQRAKNTWDFARAYKNNPELIEQVKTLFP